MIFRYLQQWGVTGEREMGQLLAGGGGIVQTGEDMPCQKGVPIWRCKIFEYFKVKSETWIFKQSVLFFKTVCVALTQQGC